MPMTGTMAGTTMARRETVALWPAQYAFPPRDISYATPGTLASSTGQIIGQISWKNWIWIGIPDWKAQTATTKKQMRSLWIHTSKQGNSTTSSQPHAVRMTRHGISHGKMASSPKESSHSLTANGDAQIFVGFVCFVDELPQHPKVIHRTMAVADMGVILKRVGKICLCILDCRGQIVSQRQFGRNRRR